jgi:hypothetical protein
MIDNHANQLITILSRPGLPSRLSTAHVSAALGVPWRTLGHRLLSRSAVRLALAVLGWEYSPCRGKQGGHFKRSRPDSTAALAAEIRLPWAVITNALLFYATKSTI